MAHYALINKEKEVFQVIVGATEDDLINGLSPEKSYSTIYNCIAKRTSYNTSGGIHYNRITNEPSEDQTKGNENRHNRCRRIVYFTGRSVQKN